MAKPVICEKLVKAICETLRLGAYQKEAAAVAGVCEGTLQNWIKEGGKERRHIAAGGKPRKRGSAYLDFLERLEKAKAEAQVSDLRIITQAAVDGAWQASAWKLERRNPSRWGRQRLDVETKGTLTVEGVDWLERKIDAAKVHND